MLCNCTSNIIEHFQAVNLLHGLLSINEGWKGESSKKGEYSCRSFARIYIDGQVTCQTLRQQKSNKNE